MEFLHNPTLIYFLLLIAFTSLCSQLKNIFLKFIFSITLSIFLTMEVISYWSLGKWMGFEFFSNLHLNLIKGFLFDFMKEAIFFLILTIAQYLVLYKSLVLLKKINYQIKAVILLICILILSLNNNPFAKLLEAYEVSFSETKEFRTYLPPDFVDKTSVFASKGKNIIFISVESLEKNFLDKKFNAFTQNLKKLKEEYFFYPMLQDGSGFTSGSMYSLFTSIPAIYPSFDNGNYWFQSINDFKIPSLGFVLEKAGYSKVYVLANPEFSGMDKLISSNFFNVISKNNNLGMFKDNHDLSVFNEAKLQVKELVKKNKPYALFLSTLDTHFPKGRYDKNMEEYILKTKNDFRNPLYFPIQSVDYLIGDFINFLKSIDDLENTVIFIVPDHRMMGNEADKLLKDIDNNRDLFLISNKKIKSKTISQTKLPRIIIDAANIKTNAKFVSDYENYNFNYSALNKSITKRDRWDHGFNVEFSNNRLIIYSAYEKLYDFKTDENIKLNNLDLIFNEKFNFLKAKINGKPFKPLRTPLIKNPIQLSISFKNGELKRFYFGNYADVGFYKDVKKNKFVISEKDIDIATKKGIPSFAPIDINKYKVGPKFINITSSPFGGRSEIKINNQSYAVLKRGVNIVYINQKNKLTIKNFDTYAKKENYINLIDNINLLYKNKKRFILVADDAVRSNWDNEHKIMYFSSLSSLNGRSSFIGIPN